MEANTRMRMFMVAVVILIAIALLFVDDPRLGLDLRGGARIEYVVPRDEVEDRLADPYDVVVEDVRQVIQQRVGGATGLQEITVRTLGSALDPTGKDDSRIEIQVPAGTDREAFAAQVERIKEVIETQGDLEFFEVAPDDVQSRVSGDDFEDPLPEDLQDRWQKMRAGPDFAGRSGDAFLVVDRAHVMTGADIDSAHAAPGTEGWQVNFTLGPEGTRKFANFTRNHVDDPFAVVLDDRVITAPVIQNAITEGSGRITGVGGQDEAKNLEVVLTSGRMQVIPIKSGEEFVGPQLGQAQVDRGVFSFIVAIILVAVLMLAIYMGAGLAAILALMLNALLLLAAMILFQATFTMPGIAGLILTMGMAVDANILIFERIREEQEKGKTLDTAIQNGYDRAFITILDANITTLLTAAILFYFTTGAIKGFAVTLFLGIVFSLFSAVFFTRTVLEACAQFGMMKERVKMVRIVPKDIHIAFMSWRFPAMILSLAMVTVGFGYFMSRGTEVYGMDFVGGAAIRVRLAEPMSPGEVDKLVGDMEVDGIEGVATLRDLSPVLQPVADESGEETAAKAGAYNEYILNLRSPEGQENWDVDPIVDKFLAPKNPAWGARVPEVADSREETVDGRIGTMVTIRVTGEMEDGDPIGLTEEAFSAAFDPIVERLGLEVGEVRPGPDMGDGHRLTYEVFFPDVQGADGEPEAQPWQQVRTALHERYLPLAADNPVPSQRSLGASIAGRFRQQGIWAVAVSLLAMILYITMRFEFRFGVGAVVALTHDVLIALGVMALADKLGQEWFNTPLKIDLPVIAAFLTIVGYSVNDTIVVFDRIRENMGYWKGTKQFSELINESINQCLSRTLFTSVTTLVVVATLFAANATHGGIIVTFSLALIIGVIVGTYSSIFVASPILLLFGGDQTAVEKEAAERAAS